MSKRFSYKAVILAAGLGNRISSLSKNISKPLLPIDGKPYGPTFLDWHLWSLSMAGVNDIYLVGNEKTYGTKLLAMDEVFATWLLNPTKDISSSGSAHSAWFAWQDQHNILDSKSYVFLMDADILYDPVLIKLMIDDCEKNFSSTSYSKTLVCSKYQDTDEEVLVFAKKESPHLAFVHGKGLLHTAMVSELNCAGEATGILLWHPDHHRTLREITDWTIRFSTAKTRSEHEDVTAKMMLSSMVNIFAFDPKIPFMECDTPGEYEILTQELFPVLQPIMNLMRSKQRQV